jgi:hypothetical protein
LDLLPQEQLPADGNVLCGKAGLLRSIVSRHHKQVLTTAISSMRTSLSMKSQGYLITGILSHLQGFDSYLLFQKKHGGHASKTFYNASGF